MFDGKRQEHVPQGRVAPVPQTRRFWWGQPMGKIRGSRRAYFRPPSAVLAKVFLRHSLHSRFAPGEKLRPPQTVLSSSVERPLTIGASVLRSQTLYRFSVESVQAAAHGKNIVVFLLTAHWKAGYWVHGVNQRQRFRGNGQHPPQRQARQASKK